MAKAGMRRPDPKGHYGNKIDEDTRNIKNRHVPELNGRAKTSKGKADKEVE